MAEVCEQDCSSMENKCIVDCGGDIGEFLGEFQANFSDKKEGVKEEIPFGMKSGAKIPLIFKNCVFRLC